MEIVNKPELHLETHQLKKAALVYRAVNHKLRQQVMKLLHEQKRITVTELYKKLDIEQSVASQHLAILRSAKLVSTERDGKYIFYSVNYQRLKELHELADKLLQR